VAAKAHSEFACDLFTRCPSVDEMIANDDAFSIRHDDLVTPIQLALCETSDEWAKQINETLCHGCCGTRLRLKQPSDYLV